MFIATTFRPAKWAIPLAAVVVLGLLAPAKATETINLTAIDGYSSKSMWVREFINFFIPEIDKGLAKTGNYKIKWNQAWGGQIVKPKGVMGGMQKGLGDIGVVTTVFHSDKVPLQMIAYATPFVTTDPGLVARTVDDLVEKYPAYREAWDSFNQVYLTNLAVFDTYQIFSKTPIKSLDDFKGLKIGSAGLNLRWLEGLGAAGVAGSLVTYYNKMKTGVYDAFMLWPESVVGRKMYEVAPYMLRANLGTANSKAITMNKDTWNRLPDEVRKVIQEAAFAYRDHMGKKAMDVADASYKAFVANGGTIHEMSEAGRLDWANRMPNVAKDWAASLEKKGIDGNAVLKAYMDTMRASNQPILRHWDKE
jgi:TRAP-type C4-dicarboxylate transport system substrate-binding protein